MAGGDLYPPLEFRCPSWFRGDPEEDRFPGKICWYHDDICEVVENTVRLLRGQSQPRTTEELLREEEEITQRKAIESRERDMKILELAKKKEEEVENKMKYKRERWSERLLEKQLKQEKDCRQKLASIDSSLKGVRRDIAYGLFKVWTFQMGKPYEISDLLSGRSRKTRSNRNYLINNKGVQVNVGELSGKYVLIYFWSLPDDHEHTHYKPNPEFNADLEEIYKTHREEFEIVFVALGNNEDAFSETFSYMPWLAIPHEDQQARNFFITEFAIPHPTYERAVLFSLDCTVLVANAEPTISSYGAHAFPFTKEMIDRLLFECHALRYELFVSEKMPPLIMLLGANVISREGEKVPTSNFENKTVGLYFFEQTSRGFQRTRQLLKIWKSLNDNQRDDFVIVFISKDPFSLSIDMEELKKEFRYAIPWFSVDGCGRKLCRVFRIECGSKTDEAGDLIVLKPDKYQPLSYFAFNILVKYGSDAYPFTLEKAVNLTKRKQQDQLVLSQLLSPEAPLRRGNSSYYKDCTDITVSQLSGMPVLLVFATHSCFEAGNFLSALKIIYGSTSLRFEIIYISLDCDESPSSFPKSVEDMPWLVYSFVPDFAFALVQKVFDVFPPRLPAIAVFGPSGHLVTKQSNLAFENCYGVFPYIEPHMDEEVRRELIYQYKWDLESLDEFFKKDLCCF